jgi:hypothetical protein
MVRTMAFAGELLKYFGDAFIVAKVRPPQRRGFGIGPFRRALDPSNGTIVARFQPTGIRCETYLDLPNCRVGSLKAQVRVDVRSSIIPVKNSSGVTLTLPTPLTATESMAAAMTSVVLIGEPGGRPPPGRAPRARVSL